MGPFSPLSDELREGVGNTTESGGRLVLVVTEGNIGIDVAAFGGKSVGGGGGGDRESMVAPTAVVSVSEFAGEPIVSVSRKKRRGCARKGSLIWWNEGGGRGASGGNKMLRVYHGSWSSCFSTNIFARAPESWIAARSDATTGSFPCSKRHMLHVTLKLDLGLPVGTIG